MCIRRRFRGGRGRLFSGVIREHKGGEERGGKGEREGSVRDLCTFFLSVFVFGDHAGDSKESSASFLWT